jgi:hypothetical protein
VYNDYGSVRNCLVTDDSASYGGGVYNYGTVSHCTISANQAYYYGGIRNSGTLSNCLVANNTAQNYGGIYNTGTVYNCHVVANLTTNSSTLNYSTSYATVVNTLFWGNRSQSNPNSLMQVPSSSGDYYNCAFESDIPGGNTSGCIVLSSHNTGALTSPQFIQPAYGAGHEYASGCDWTVQEGSILIDRGLYEEDSSYTSTTDLEGNPRLRGGSIDIGCYEWVPGNGINTIANKTSFTIHPNPASTHIVVQNADSHIAIYDMMGRLMLRTSANNNAYIDISSLPRGIYILRSGNATARLVKK